LGSGRTCCGRDIATAGGGTVVVRCEMGIDTSLADAASCDSAVGRDEGGSGGGREAGAVDGREAGTGDERAEIGAVGVTGGIEARMSAAALNSWSARSSSSRSLAVSAARRSHRKASSAAPLAQSEAAVESAQWTSSLSFVCGGGMAICRMALMV
jgi:hypothetical protein